MTRGKRGRGSITAAELMAQLAEDPEYQERVAKHQAELEERARLLDEAEEPIVADLRAAGVHVDSVWDLVNTSEPYPVALPVLMEHLERGGYPDRVMESMGRALAVKPSIVFWDRLKALYQEPRSEGEQEGTAVALAASAGTAQLEDLIEFLSLEERGQSRIYFIRPILAVGGDRGREVVKSLRADSVFGKEATLALSGRK